jgi:hypothetical protein
VSGMVGRGELLGSTDSLHKIDISIPVMVSGVTLLTVSVWVARNFWVSTDSREQLITCSVVSRHSLHRGHKIKYFSLIRHLCLPPFHHPFANLEMRCGIVGGPDLMAFPNPCQSMMSHVGSSQSCRF